MASRVMNWKFFRLIPWVDPRVRFVAAIPRNGVLLDLGSSDGETLNHIAELRPDLRLFACDIDGVAEKYPVGCEYSQSDLQKDRLPWPDASLDGITCMHLVEHLESLENLFHEISRLLKPGGRIYVETPHPKSVDFPAASGSMVGKFTLNFYDDKTHVAPVPTDKLASLTAACGLKEVRRGISRNWLFALSYFLLFFTPASRKKLTAYVHLRGWSAYFIAQK